MTTTTQQITTFGSANDVHFTTSSLKNRAKCAWPATQHNNTPLVTHPQHNNLSRCIFLAQPSLTNQQPSQEDKYYSESHQKKYFASGSHAIIP
mmetsp:Transcript_25045/g.40639  ORF Transcript_25045/g.40639 Transcript_25045/m.40639 type:complete len:93 (-) Transcript_25045:590-868(-)